MHIKRFEADSMEAALAAVRAELGPEALILSSRTIRRGRGAFGLLARDRVEVQAALERGGAAGDARGDDPGITALLEGERPADDDGSRAGFGAGTAASIAPGDEVHALIRELRRELAWLRGRAGFEEELRGELGGLRRLVESALRRPEDRDADAACEALLARGIELGPARALVSDWRARTAEGERITLAALLRERLEARLVPPREEPPGRLRVLVGAPGVGKTTSLAKLAARNEEGERDLALVALDHYRIGATDQLRRYAALLDAPFHEIDAAEALPALAGRHRDRVLMVDTAGRDPMSESQLGSLAPLRERLGGRVSIDLVLDATARIEVQRTQLRRFAGLAPDRILLTKVDECPAFGAVASLLLDEDCPPLCWLGTGQRVPEDLAEATSERLMASFSGAAA